MSAAANNRCRHWSRCDIGASGQQHHGKLSGAELLIEFACEIARMSGIGETGFFVLGSGMLSELIAGFEVDGLSLIVHCPDAGAGQHLLIAIGLAIDVL